MISSIGFIPNKSDILELNEFIPNEDVKKQLDYLQIPIFPKESEDQIEMAGERFPEVKSTDKILFCTSNTEEMSSVAFYGYDDTEMYLHHDFVVFSTILDSCYIKDTLVAVATFEPDIMVYDFMIDFPILPQYLLTGHTEMVTGIKNKFERLMSCSEDKTIIEWDINELRLRNQKSYDIAIERFDYEGNNLVFGAKDYLNINNESISLQYELEQLKIKDNFVYVSDCEGNMNIYDVRSPNNVMINQKLHESALVDFSLAKDWIVTAATDSLVKLWKIEDSKLVCKNEIPSDQNPSVSSLGFNGFCDFNEVFAGDENDAVFPIKLEELLQL